jgi:hypothetical protein
VVFPQKTTKQISKARTLLKLFIIDINGSAYV